MSISQEILDEINKGYKVPNAIKICPRAFEFLVLDRRLKMYKFDNYMISKLNGIPVIIDQTITTDYIIQY